MEPDIHPSAVVEEGARLDPGVRIGPNCVISSEAVIGPGCVLESSVVLEGKVQLGEKNHLYPGVIVGTPPMDYATPSDIDSRVQIGSGNIIREYTTIHRATREGEATIVGDNNMLMTYSHVAHDCILGSRITLVSSSALAGFVQVEDGAFISGLCGVHQFVRIGKLAMIGGCSKITQDLPPFFTADGNPARICGVNSVGLRRWGMGRKERQVLKKALEILYYSSLNTAQALARLEAEFGDEPNCRHLMNFIRASERGIMKKTRSVRGL